MDAHFLFDGADGHRVAFAKRAVFLDHELGHDEQRYALDTFGAAFDLGQHQMDDVIGHVVFTGRDKDLLAGDLIAAVFLWRCFGTHQAQIGAAVGLCQVHGAGPFAGHHVGQICILLGVRAVGEDRRGRTVGQALIHGERLVGRREHLAHCGAEDIGHVLAAVLLWHVQTGPAAFLDLRKGVLEPFGGVDDAVLQTAAFLITYRVQRSEDFGGQLACFFQNGRGEIRLKLVVAGGGRRGDVQHIVQDELHILDRGGVARHVVFSLGHLAVVWSVYLGRCIRCSGAPDCGPILPRCGRC